MATEPDLKKTETPYNWGYVTLAAGGSRYYKNGTSKDPSHHAPVLKFLISRGAPVDLPDIAGLTALHHVSMTNRDGDVLRCLLEHGANPNKHDVYGTTPLHYAVKNGQAEAVEMCLKYNGDLDKQDNDGVAVRLMLPFVEPRITAVVEKHRRSQLGSPAPLENKNQCANCGKGGTLSQCAKCRTVRYCSTDCQSTFLLLCLTRSHSVQGSDWKRGHKQACSAFDNQGVTIICKPWFRTETGLQAASVSRVQLARARLASVIPCPPDGEGKRDGNVPVKIKTVTYERPPASVLGKPMVVKIQIPSNPHIMPDQNEPPIFMMTVYNKTRQFSCGIMRDSQEAEYSKIEAVIREKGALGGIKGYFTAELETYTRLRIKIGEILAEQPW